MVAHSVENALRLARQHEKKEIFIIGGGQIYTAALPATDRLYLTLVDDDADGDTYFPPYEAFSQTISRENRKLRGLLYSFVVLER
jgi:dihydrofolate reductase